MSLRHTKVDEKKDETPLLAPGNRGETNLVSGKIGNWAMVRNNYITYNTPITNKMFLLINSEVI